MLLSGHVTVTHEPNGGHTWTHITTVEYSEIQSSTTTAVNFRHAHSAFVVQCSVVCVRERTVPHTFTIYSFCTNNKIHDFSTENPNNCGLCGDWVVPRTLKLTYQIIKRQNLPRIIIGLYSGVDSRQIYLIGYSTYKCICIHLWITVFVLRVRCHNKINK